MDTLPTVSIIAALLKALADTAASAQPGQESEKLGDLAEYLDLASTAAQRTEGAREALIALTTQIQGFVAENRDPTDEEWSALRARSDAAHETIQAPIEPSAE